jgi:glycosyltransferase involved in cell wall biosynthesis
MSITFSSQVFEACRALNVRASVVAQRSPKQRFEADGFTIHHCEPILPKAKGAMYHVAMMLSGLRLDVQALKQRADVVVVSSGTAHWFMLRPLQWAGVKVIPAYHNRALGPSDDDRPISRLVNRLNARVLRAAAAVLVPSRDVGEQVKQIAGGIAPPLLEYLPIYRADTFGPATARDSLSAPFRVLFVGRVEEIKGVFLLLEVARRLQAQGVPIEFDLCGGGGALDELRKKAIEVGVGSIFRLHGQLKQKDMRAKLAQAHVLVVPSTHQVGEGQPMVVAEAIVAGLPSLISTACPADYVRSAVEVLPPEDVDAWAEALQRLMREPARYQALVRGTEQLKAQFLDPERGFGASLRVALQELQRGRQPPSVSWLPPPISERQRAAPKIQEQVP